MGLKYFNYFWWDSRTGPENYFPWDLRAFFLFSYLVTGLKKTTPDDKGLGPPDVVCVRAHKDEVQSIPHGYDT